MGLFEMFDKLDDIVYEPVKLVTDWAREPLKRREHKRNIEKETARLNAETQNRIKEKEAEVNLSIKEKEAEANLIFRNIEKETARLNAETQNRIKEKEAEVNLAIKKETEIKRVLVEIEEFKKDKEFERMKAVSEAIMKYQEELTRLNVNAINAIGHMQLELREKAQQLVYDKTIRYKELQDQAISEALNDLRRIEDDFSGNDRAKDILIKAVDKRLANIIDTAHNFLIELNADIKLLNQSISLLAEQGQRFIESHLEKFHVMEATSEEIKRIEEK